MAEVGESTGALPAMLNSVAEFFEGKNIGDIVHRPRAPIAAPRPQPSAVPAASRPSCSGVRTGSRPVARAMSMRCIQTSRVKPMSKR